MTRVGPIMRVVRDAAVVDPEMAEQWATNETQTAAAFRVLAEQLDATHALGVSVDEATDILRALSSLGMYTSCSPNVAGARSSGNVSSLTRLRTPSCDNP